MKASSFTRKVKHLTRSKFVLVNSRAVFADMCAALSCPRCGWRGLWAHTFRRPSRWTVHKGIMRREAFRFFVSCPSFGCTYWEEVR